MTRQEFIVKINSMIPNDTKLLRSVTIAQSILESSDSKGNVANSNLTRFGSALFGIKASGNWKGRVYNCKTHECYDGKTLTSITDGFRAYNNWAESIADHEHFLTVENVKRYGNIIGDKDYKSVCNKLQLDGYATSVVYGKTLISLIEQYKLYQYDNINPTPVVNILPTPTSTSHQVGQQITIASFATQWETGENIPSFIRGKKYFIKQVDTVKARVLIAPSMTGAVTGWLRFQDIQ